MIILFFSLFLISMLSAGNDFVIKKKEGKRLSVTALKESLGASSRDALYSATTTLRRIGALQVRVSEQLESGSKKKGDENSIKIKSLQAVTFHLGKATDCLASLYDRFSSIIEQLLNNEKNFKKAKRLDLERACSCVGNINQKLTLCFKEACIVEDIDVYIQKEHRELKSALALLDNIDCLSREKA